MILLTKNVQEYELLFIEQWEELLDLEYYKSSNSEYLKLDVRNASFLPISHLSFDRELFYQFLHTLITLLEKIDRSVLRKEKLIFCKNHIFFIDGRFRFIYVAGEEVIPRRTSEMELVKSILLEMGIYDPVLLAQTDLKDFLTIFDSGPFYQAVLVDIQRPSSLIPIYYDYFSFHSISMKKEFHSWTIYPEESAKASGILPKINGRERASAFPLVNGDTVETDGKRYMFIDCYPL